jgi:hypothetical protein
MAGLPLMYEPPVRVKCVFLRLVAALVGRTLALKRYREFSRFITA